MRFTSLLPSLLFVKYNGHSHHIDVRLLCWTHGAMDRKARMWASSKSCSLHFWSCRSCKQMCQATMSSQKTAAKVTANANRLVSLSHIKAPEPDAPTAPPPFLGSRMAHPGGKITSNKPQALAKFLAKKQGKGEITALSLVCCGAG